MKPIYLILIVGLSLFFSCAKKEKKEEVYPATFLNEDLEEDVNAY